ncbi:MAG TPA: hypothetical protein VE954_28790 [Oligoflexus sp.]|uniref:hypothetical protein n=1 Tax=Oligoflexus sp. TaxID=1971216 RepID=UPI002D55259F|nr:hypothetical protein [Oligoflexus sp.]HYX37118.1 hypothetical protein [Oligoflexus sp.]
MIIKDLPLCSKSEKSYANGRHLGSIPCARAGEIMVHDHFLVFIDDTGNVLSIKEKKQYGLGFCAFPSSIANDLHSDLNSAFPRGIHMKNLRKRKSQISANLTQLLSKYPDVLAGSYIETNTQYVDHVIADSLLKSADKFPKKMIEYISKAELNPLGFISSSHDAMGDIPKFARLSHFVAAALRLPLLCIAKTFDVQDRKISVDLFIPNCGHPDNFARELEGSYAKAISNFKKSFPTLLEALKIPPFDVHIESYLVKPTIFMDVADTFAMAGQKTAEAIVMNSPSAPELFLSVLPILRRSQYGVIPGMLISKGGDAFANRDIDEIINRWSI